MNIFAVFTSTLSSFWKPARLAILILGLWMPFRAMADAPSVSITSPSDNSTVGILSQLTGTVADNSGTGIAGVTLTLQQGSSYWNGAGWQSTATTLDANVPGDGTWNYSTLPAGTAILAGAYTLTATATDGLNDTTTATISFTLTPPPPDISVTSPSAAYINSLVSIGGAVDDPSGSGFLNNQVGFTLAGLSNQYWNGSAWTATPTVLYATIESDDTWTYPADSTLAGATLPTDNGSYTISASVTNGLGILSQSAPSDNLAFIVDNTPPTCAIAAPANGSTITTLVGAGDWFSGAASDQYPLQPAVTLYIERLADGTYWDGYRWNESQQLAALSGAYTQAQGTGWTCAQALPRLGFDYGSSLMSGSYKFIAIATDYAGNTTESDSLVTVNYNPAFPAASFNPQQTPVIDGSTLSGTPGLSYAFMTGVNYVDYESSYMGLLVDGTGSIIMEAVSQYRAPLEGTPAPPSSSVAKFSASGALLWQRQRTFDTVVGAQTPPQTTYFDNWGDGTGDHPITAYDATTADALIATQVDAQGNVYAAYNVETEQQFSTVNSGGGQSSYYAPGPTMQVLIVKFDLNGVFQWEVTNPADGYTGLDHYPVSNVLSLKVLPDNNVAVLVYNYEPSGPGFPAVPQTEVIFIGANGTVINDDLFGYGGLAADADFNSQPLFIDCDGSGNVYVASEDAAGPNSAEYDLNTIRKFDSSGNLLGSVQVNLSDFDETWAGMHCDSAGNVYVGGTIVTGLQTQDVRQFAAKFDTNLNFLWRSYGPPDSGGAVSFCLNTAGVTVAGTGPIDYTTGFAFPHWAITRFGTDGTLQWSDTYQDPNGETEMQYAVTDGNANVYVFGYIPIEGTDQFQPVYAEYSANGVLQFISDTAFYNANAGNVTFYNSQLYTLSPLYDLTAQTTVGQLTYLPVTVPVTPASYTVTPGAGANGAIGPVGAQTIASGGSVLFTATPASNYVVNQWLLNGSVVQTGGATYTVSDVTADDAIDVTFAAAPGNFTVNPSAGANGDIAPSTAQTVTGGGGVMFTATPSTGYFVNEWLVNGSAVQTGGATYTVSDVTANDTVEATFAATTVTPFPGVYQALFVDGVDHVTITLDADGSFTAKAIVGGISLTIRGLFNAAGIATVTAPIPVTLQLGVTQGSGPGSHFITGFLTGGGSFAAYHTANSKPAGLPANGKVSFHITAATTGPGIPTGPGKVTLTIYSTGGLRFAVKLPDSVSFTGAASIVGGPNGEQCILDKNIDYSHSTPRGTRGSLKGVITFSSGLVTGPILWTKPAETKGKYGTAFQTDLTISP